MNKTAEMQQIELENLELRRQVRALMDERGQLNQDAKRMVDENTSLRLQVLQLQTSSNAIIDLLRLAGYQARVAVNSRVLAWEESKGEWDVFENGRYVLSTKNESEAVAALIEG